MLPPEMLAVIVDPETVAWIVLNPVIG